MSKNNQWKTRDEICEDLGVCDRTIRRYVTKGKVLRKGPTHGPGARPLYKVVSPPEQSISAEELDIKPFRDQAVKQKASLFAKNAVISFKDRIKRLKDLYPTTPSVNSGTMSSDKPSLVLAIGDTHVGKKTKHYNIEVAKQSILSIPEQINNLCLPEFDEIVVLMIGDMIDGEDIYPTQSHSIQVPAITQANIAAETLYVMLSRLAQYTGAKIRVETCPGNHGRTSKTANVITNWDNIVYDMLYIANTFNENDMITINSSYDQFNQFKVKDKTGLINHYGTKHTGTPAMLVKNAGWLQTSKFDFLVHGHYHKLEFGSLFGRLIVANGSLVGQDDLSEKMGTFDPPRQAWLLVEPNKPISQMGFLSFNHANLNEEQNAK